MALSLSLGEPGPFRFGPVFPLYFRVLPSNPAKTRKRVPKDFDGIIARTRSRRVARDASVNRRIFGVGSRPVSLRERAWIKLRSRRNMLTEPKFGAGALLSAFAACRLTLSKRDYQS